MLLSLRSRRLFATPEWSEALRAEVLQGFLWVQKIGGRAGQGPPSEVSRRPWGVIYPGLSLVGWVQLLFFVFFNCN